MSLSHIVQLLPGLSPAELEQLRSRVGAMLSISGSAPPRASPEDSDERWILDCIYQYSRSQGQDLTPVSMLRQDKSMPKIRRYIPELIQYLETGAGKQRVQREALLKIGIGLLADNYKEMRLPVTSRMLLRGLPRLPAVINRSFPGYWQQGTLSWVIQMHNRGQHVSQ